MTDILDLERFISQQDASHAQALAELRAGLKLSHWIWWELPQLRGLGRSARAHEYGLADLEEATRYLAHPVLGPRLVEMCMALLMHARKPPESILGPVDALKVRSMATLFSHVPGAPAVFKDVLEGFYGGFACEETLRQLRVIG